MIIPLFMDVNILPISRLYFKYVFSMREIHINSAPSQIVNLFQQKGSIHAYNTRSSFKNNMYIKRIWYWKTNYFQWNLFVIALIGTPRRLAFWLTACREIVGNVEVQNVDCNVTTNNLNIRSILILSDVEQIYILISRAEVTFLIDKSFLLEQLTLGIKDIEI